MPPSLRVLLAGSLFALGGALLKSCDFPSLQRAGIRAAVAAATIFLLLPAARMWPDRRILLLAPAYFGATCLYVIANAMTTAANAIFLQSTAPLWLILFGPWLLKERPSQRDVITLVCVAVGMAMCFLAPAEVVKTAPDPRLGNWFAVASGICFALVLLGMRWLSRTEQGHAAAALAWGNAFTFPLAFMLMPLVGQQPIAGGPRDWVLIVVLGSIQVGLAYVILVRAMSLVPAMRASLLLMVEPALNPTIAWFVHHEAPHWLAVAGGVLIVGSVLLASVLVRHRAEPPPVAGT